MSALSSIKPPGTHVMLNPWMVIPEKEAKENEKAAHDAGDNEVRAVPITQAMLAPEMLEALEVLRAKVTVLLNASDHCWNDWPESYAIDALITQASEEINMTDSEEGGAA